MTENEAIKELLDYVAENDKLTISIETVTLARKALEEIQQYREIGTVEELKALKEKLENAKDDIRKLLCSEYGSSCQFCIHDENEDAMCCNIGGSGSWCCENARWQEH